MTDIEQDNEFAPPPYTVIDRRKIGDRVVTTVCFDGEIAEFEIGVECAEGVSQLVSDERKTSNAEIERMMERE